MQQSGIPNINENAIKFIYEQLNYSFTDVKRREGRKRIKNDIDGTEYFTR